MADNSNSAVSIVAILVIVILAAVVLYFLFTGGMFTRGGSTVNVVPTPTPIEAPKPTTTP